MIMYLYTTLLIFQALCLCLLLAPTGMSGALIRVGELLLTYAIFNIWSWSSPSSDSPGANGSSKSISNELYILPFIFLAFLYLRFYTLTFDLRRAQAETGRLKSELGILRRERARDHQIRVHLEQNGVGAKPKEEEEARAALGLRKAVRSPGDEAVMEELKRKLALSSISGPGSGSGSTIRLGSSNENGSGDRSQVQTWGMPRKRVVAQDIWVPGALSKTSL